MWRRGNAGRNESTRSGSSFWKEPGFDQNERHPVACVNWEDARAYARWLSRKTGEEYRLLSESEWEYVARGGTQASRYWQGSEVSQCQHVNGTDKALRRQFGDTLKDAKIETASCDDGHIHTSPVGTYKTNGYGVYDVMGNVWEWVEDCYHDDYRGAPSDGSAWTTGGDCSRRVIRGGSWADAGPIAVRSAMRDRSPPVGGRDIRVGFRVARTLGSKQCTPYAPGDESRPTLRDRVLPVGYHEHDSCRPTVAGRVDREQRHENRAGPYTKLQVLR